MTGWRLFADAVSDRAFTALLAVLLNLTVGTLLQRRLSLLQNRIDHRVQRYFLRAEVKLNRTTRSVASRRWRGMVVVVWPLVVAGVLGALWIGFVPVRLRAPVELAALWMLLPLAPAFARVRDVLPKLAPGGAGEATARLAIEMLARAGIDRMVPLVTLYLVLGAPGIVVWLTLHHAHHGLAQPLPRLKDFGIAATVLHAWFTALPRVLGCFLACTAGAFVPGAHPAKGWATAMRHPRVLAEATYAGMLGIALVGPRTWQNEKLPMPWIGDGSARATPRDVTRAQAVTLVMVLVAIAALALMSLERS